MKKKKKKLFCYIYVDIQNVDLLQTNYILLYLRILLHYYYYFAHIYYSLKSNISYFGRPISLFLIQVLLKFTPELSCNNFRLRLNDYSINFNEYFRE
jgi:hypothetical protein